MEFEGVTFSLDEDALIVRSDEPLTMLSSAVVGGGLTRARFIINRHVSKDYDQLDPAADLRSFARQRGIDEAFVGLMTAVYMHNAQFHKLQAGAVEVGLALTAGYSNKVSAGITPPADLRPGTINLILFVQAQLSPAAMVNAIMTATEAKTATLQAWPLYTADGNIATGTSTDAVVVACTGRGPRLPYAGPATPVGAAIARLVRIGIDLTRP
jgi:iron complex transport system ATP-binding protein